MIRFTFKGTINTRSRGIIDVDGNLPEDILVDQDVIEDGTEIVVINDLGAEIVFKRLSAVNLLKVELKQISKPTVH